MCGICGIFVDQDHQGDPEQIVRAMTAVQRHRGPDGEGYHSAEKVSLGSCRLSIIDLVGSDMPIYNEDGSIALVFNGEIYGYVELRAELERRGHRFATQGDTETIVHAYEEYGERCVEHLNGMFAFALWDANRRTLLLARDRVGEKPLFYTWVGRTLLFASEMKALLQYPAVSRAINQQALTHYLTALYIPYPQTILRDVYKLPPGHTMTVTSSNSRTVRYWHPEQIRPQDISEAEAIESFHTIFEDAVRLQMRSDVPVGAFLSAGMDSTSIVAQAARSSQNAKLKTFAVGFEGADWDERVGARAVADMYGTDHYDVSVSTDDVRRLLPQLVWHMDEPMGDGSIVPLYVVSMLARQHVKVALCGAGGDELFGGYSRYRIGHTSKARRMLMLLPEPLKQMAEFAGYRYSPGFGNRVHVNVRTIDRHYYEDLTWFTDAERLALTGRNGAPYADVVARHYARLDKADPVNRLMFVDMNTYMADDLLPMTDRMTMGASLEGRLPFLDYRLVEWSLSLPSELKLRNGVGKYILRQAMAGLLPDDILSLPKRGFGPPFDVWLREGLLDATRTLLRSSAAAERGIYRSSFLDELWTRDLKDHRTTQQIWMLLVLELWFRLYIDRADPTAVPDSLDEFLI